MHAQIEMCDLTTEFEFIHFQTIHNDESPTSLFNYVIVANMKWYVAAHKSLALVPLGQ